MRRKLFYPGLSKHSHACIVSISFVSHKKKGNTGTIDCLPCAIVSRLWLWSLFTMLLRHLWRSYSVFHWTRKVTIHTKWTTSLKKWLNRGLCCNYLIVGEGRMVNRASLKRKQSVVSRLLPVFAEASQFHSTSRLNWVWSFCKLTNQILKYVQRFSI